MPSPPYFFQVVICYSGNPILLQIFSSLAAVSDYFIVNSICASMNFIF